MFKSCFCQWVPELLFKRGFLTLGTGANVLELFL